MGPSHFLSDDLVTIRVIDILLKQLHVTFGFTILLLEKSLPIVLVPSTLWLIIEISHTPFLYLRLSEAAKLLSRMTCSRSWPQAALISCPFSRRIVASIPHLRRVR